ncbi:MAG: hypothetical protein ACTIKR_19610 [Advenella sp.]|uniref:hypothetical protein n=1 Tax=Advenella sp. TaxID=1872388 RepID=UPI003F9E3E16
MVAQIFEVRYITTLFGFLFLGHQIGGFLGVWLGGWVYDSYRSYDLLWLGFIAIGLVASFVHRSIDDRPLTQNAFKPVNF